MDSVHHLSIRDVKFLGKIFEEKGPLQDLSHGTKSHMLGHKLNNGTSKTKASHLRWTGTRCFVLEVPLCNLHPSLCDFVPCEQIMQKTYSNYRSMVGEELLGTTSKSDFWAIALQLGLAQKGKLESFSLHPDKKVVAGSLGSWTRNLAFP